MIIKLVLPEQNAPAVEEGFIEEQTLFLQVLGVRDQLYLVHLWNVPGELDESDIKAVYNAGRSVLHVTWTADDCDGEPCHWDHQFKVSSVEFLNDFPIP